jgi:hypothetical protein
MAKTSLSDDPQTSERFAEVSFSMSLQRLPSKYAIAPSSPTAYMQFDEVPNTLLKCLVPRGCGYCNFQERSGYTGTKICSVLVLSQLVMIAREQSMRQIATRVTPRRRDLMVRKPPCATVQVKWHVT